MKYLITGGAGFIGSHLADLLIKNGHEVTVIDNLSTGSLSNINHLRGNAMFDMKVGSVMDYSILEQLVENCDQIFHLAAAVGVKLIMENPVETITTNVQGTENILKLASYYDKKVLVASTSEVYGKLMESNGDIKKLNEQGDWQLGPTSKRRWAYACSKAMDEFLSLAYFDEKKLPVVVVRFFNTVGPRQTGRYGMVIPNFIQKALLNETIQVHGDGEQTRCFTHVDDVINAVVELMDTPEAEGQVFNIGGEEEVSINELATRIREKADSSSEIAHIPYGDVYGKGFEDMQRRTPDLTKIKSAIGYEPAFSTDDIIKSVINYFRREVHIT
jgi:UDP-glucose 4-epimerase